jgi:asparagine synthase (glutamine-hydrolysing)
MLERMNRTMTHRGPDDEGYYLSGQVGLAMRRLSIIDLEGGRQPVSNEDDTLSVVYNGEIYNFPELRDELLSRGHRFRSRSDTEVIVHLYEEIAFLVSTACSRSPCGIPEMPASSSPEIGSE